MFLVATQVFGEGYLLAAKAGLDIGSFLAVLRASSAGLYMPLADMIVKRQWESSNYDLSLAGAHRVLARSRTPDGEGFWCVSAVV